MEEDLKEFLTRFAELERRVRKLVIEDRSLRDEVEELKEELDSSRAEAASLRDRLDRERESRSLAQQKLDGLIDWIEKIQDGRVPAPESQDHEKAEESDHGTAG